MQTVASELGFSRHMGWVLDFGTERGHGAIRTIVASLLGLTPDASLGDIDEANVAAAAAGKANDDALFLRDLLEVPQREGDRSLYEALDVAVARAARSGWSRSS